MFFPIVGKTLVESGVFFFRNIFSLLHPDGLGLVLIFEFSVDFLYLFLFLIFFLIIFLFDFNISFVFLFSVFFLIFFFFIIGDFLFNSLFNLQLDWETDEFRVLLDKILESFLFKEVQVVVLHLQDNLSTSGESFWIISIFLHTESTSS